MTSIENLKSIFKNNLLSHTDAHEKGLVKRDISNIEVNSRREREEPINNRKIHDYVPLYFNPKNPMLYVRKDMQHSIIILEIDNRLIYQDNNLFTDGNAASNPTKFFNNLTNLDNLNWECIRGNRWNNYTDGKRIRCAEVLAYPKILNRYINKIYCNNTVTLNKIREIAHSNNIEIKCDISSKYYF